MATVKVGLAVKAPSLDPARFGKFDMVIPYTIDGAGPFDVRIPQEDFNEQAAEDLIRKAAQAQVALKDREIKI